MSPTLTVVRRVAITKKNLTRDAAEFWYGPIFFCLFKHHDRLELWNFDWIEICKYALYSFVIDTRLSVNSTIIFDKRK